MGARPLSRRFHPRPAALPLFLVPFPGRVPLRTGTRPAGHGIRPLAPSLQDGASDPSSVSAAPRSNGPLPDSLGSFRDRKDRDGFLSLSRPRFVLLPPDLPGVPVFIGPHRKLHRALPSFAPGLVRDRDRHLPVAMGFRSPLLRSAPAGFVRPSASGCRRV